MAEVSLNINRYISFFIIISGFLTNPIYGQYWKKINTPPDRNFTHNLIPLTNEIIGVSDILGVWLTTDKGKTWNRTLNTYNILTMQNSNGLYALGGIGKSFIYKSNKVGSDWKNLATDSITRPFVITMAMRDTNEMFALGTKMGGDSPWLYRTTNGGVSWFSASISEPLYFRTILALPYNIIYGLHDTFGFYRSTDNGGTWTARVTGLVTTSFTSLIKNSVGHLFISSTKGTIFRSTDGGGTWISVTSSFSTAMTLNSLLCIPSDEMYLLADSSSQHSVYKSIDGGMHWLHIGEPVLSSSPVYMAVTPSGSVILLMNYDLYTNDPSFNVSGMKNEHASSIFTYNLDQNYPNPFNPTTTISFNIPGTSFVSLRIFDMLGREVASLAAEEMNAGSYTRQWNAKDYPSGIYFYRLQAGYFTETKKLLLFK